MLPIRFEYVNDIGTKVYLSILGELKHHYTGETIYHVREEGDSGWIGEGFRSQAYVDSCLERSQLQALGERMSDGFTDGLTSMSNKVEGAE
jgi:hypothetical protein